MLDGRWRTSFEKGLRPVGMSLRRTGISADHLTALGALMSVAAAVAIGLGYLPLGFALVLLTAVPDVLDGAVAKAAGTASPRGAFFDSVMDRVSDAFLLGGVAWYLAGESPYLPMLAFTVAVLSMLVSYERARAEGLGYDARGGLMERAERMVLLGIGLTFHILVPVLWLMIVLTTLTAVQRFIKVWRQASDLPARPKIFEARHRRPARMSGADTDRFSMLARWREQRRPDARREARRQARAARRSRP